MLNKVAQMLIRLYQVSLSPYMGWSCRYRPTCSAYAQEAFATHSFFKALYLTVRRLLRCHPWGGAGYDPVPFQDQKNKTER